MNRNNIADSFYLSLTMQGEPFRPWGRGQRRATIKHPDFEVSFDDFHSERRWQKLPKLKSDIKVLAELRGSQRSSAAWDGGQCHDDA